ncbi:hypothetical protein Tdes44962_MAKER05577 [Teratosphaeria destructans]|uniref:Uncharacterized protein n=1 Tax=Teratosphaeria destructans TaxID=418781 RepID=A0A9W7SJM9_9PEZI|nr:hypothetical protein Tdes44962_MAKER05577 [Teratosphaeria destructans]
MQEAGSTLRDVASENLPELEISGFLADRPPSPFAAKDVKDGVPFLNRIRYPILLQRLAASLFFPSLLSYDCH